MKVKNSRIISILLAIVMIASTTVTGFADEVPPEAAEKPEAAEQSAEKEAAQEEQPEEVKPAEPAKQETAPEAAPAPEPAGGQAEAEPVSPAEGQTAVQAPPADDQEQPAASEPKQDAQSAAKTEAQPQAQNTGHRVLSSGLSNGTYKADSFSFTGGTGKVKYQCQKVIVKDGQYWAVFETSSDSQTHVYRGYASKEGELTDLYDPKTGVIGKDVCKVSDHQFCIQAEINKAFDVSARTVAMSAPKWIAYKFTITLSDDAEKISDDTDIPESGSDDPEPEPEKEPEKEKKEPKKKGKLKPGTYKVKATTDRRMFYLYPKEKDPARVILVVKKNGKMTATITLTGSGYDYVFMGSYKKAIKKANKSKRIRYKKVKGYYTFKIPVSALDKKLTISPHSWKYQKQYGDTLNKDHCPWRPGKWIMFYSKGAKKVKDGAAIKTKGKASNRNTESRKETPKVKNDGKAEKESKYQDDSGKSTSAVNNSTGLKDGVYQADQFRWSGGSGRLAYIRCNKITVRGGKAFATIEFSSSKYDSLKANGRVYSKSGGGNSQFTIPVTLNKNNTIIGRTTAMSQPHWVKYSIYIYKKGAGAKGSSGDTEEGDDGHLTSTKKLSEKAPDLLGLEFKEKVEVKYAKYFKIYKYEQGITLIEVDQASDTALFRKEKKDKSGESKSGDNKTQDTVEYDEDGKPIAKGQNEITEALYRNNVVNYLIVPKDADLPAGLEKDCVIIEQPADAGYIASIPALRYLSELGVLDSVSNIGADEKSIKGKAVLDAVKAGKITVLGETEKPDYAALIKAKTDIAIFPEAVLPEIVSKKAGDKEKTESKAKAASLAVLQSRFAALGIPMIIDRSKDEETNYAEAEWIKVYGAIYGEEDKAEKVFDDFVKDNKEKKKA